MLLLAVTQTLLVQGQTCCTGGVPILDAYTTPSVGKNDIGLHFSYNFNHNNDLLSNQTVIDNSHISRTISSFLVQADYGLTDNLSLAITLPFLIQEEKIDQGNSSQKYTNNGIGDIALWLSYKKSFSLLKLNGSISIKAPTGSTNKTAANDIPLPISLQTGSGSWDMVLLLQSSWYLGSERKFSIENQLSSRLNTAGKNFDAHPNYKFGSQIQTFGGLAYHFLLGTLLTDFYTGASYQFRNNDTFDGGFENTNTGGHWVNLNLGANMYITPDLFFAVSGGFPIYRSINGLQLSTTWQSQISLNIVL